MKKIILASLLAFGFTASAMASEDGSGAYVGLGYGTTAFGDDDIGNNNTLGSLKDDADSGFKVYGGYQFNKIVGVEATYTDYGTFSYGDRNLEATSMSVGANLGYNFLDGQLRPFALVGLSYLNLDQSQAIYDADNTVAFAYGVGIEYAPTVLDGLGFRASWNADIFAVEKILSDETYTQAFGMLNVSVQYKF